MGHSTSATLLQPRSQERAPPDTIRHIAVMWPLESLSCRRVHGVNKCVLANGNATFQSRPNHSRIASTSFDGIGVTG